MADQLPSSDSTKSAAQKAAKGRISDARKLSKSPEVWASDIIRGNRKALSQAITLTESAKSGDQLLLDQVLQSLQTKKEEMASVRVGITGVPGVGKSTFIEQYGLLLAKQGHHVAVLAVDPSSGITKGSILGDKTRMELLAKHENAFIRPSPTAAALGGITRGTHEATLLCEAAGFDRILIETVGVGQSEIAVRQCSDAFILLMLPGGGDELQGIKRGIMEMADVLLINKADGNGLPLARETAAQYLQALHLFPPNTAGHSVDVQLISALQNEGINAFEEHLKRLITGWQANGSFLSRRGDQAAELFAQHVQHLSIQSRLNDATGQRIWDETMAAVRSGQTNPYTAARNWLEKGTS